MKTVYLAAAAILIASSAAQAGSSIAFDFDGHKVRVTVPRNCQSLSCLQVSGIDMSALKSSGLDGDASASSAPAAAPPAAAAPVAAPPVVNAPAPVAAPAATTQAAPAPVAQPTTVQMPVPPAPVSSTASAQAAPPLPAAAPAPAPPPATATVAAAPAAAQPAPAPDPNSPLGLWATEGGKGNVVIEPCGANICGFAEKTREKILINMRPKDSKWVGRIHDPDGGGNYDSTIALKGPNSLRVQGCAFGGLFCGGQTWKRVG